MGADIDFDGLFEGLDENDPLWRQAELMAEAPPRPGKGYVTAPLAWLARALALDPTATQLVVALLIYRECLLRRNNTVPLPNGELRKLGISRWAKYRALRWLRDAGVLTVEGWDGRSVRTTLVWFP